LDHKMYLLLSVPNVFLLTRKHAWYEWKLVEMYYM
jgi:hypothetical protein